MDGDVKPLALSPSSFFHWSNRRRRKRAHTTDRKELWKFSAGVANLSHIIYIMAYVDYNKLIEGMVAGVSSAFVWLKSELTVDMLTYNLKRAPLLSSYPRHFISST